jgi:hypothetical protein
MLIPPYGTNFGGDSTNWFYSPNGTNIESMRQWLLHMDPARIRALADLWGHASDALSTVTHLVFAGGMVLQSVWQSPAGQAYLHEMSTTLRSVNDWQHVAADNAAGLHLVADAVSTAKANPASRHDPSKPGNRPTSSANGSNAARTPGTTSTAKRPLLTTQPSRTSSPTKPTSSSSRSAPAALEPAGDNKPAYVTTTVLRLNYRRPQHPRQQVTPLSGDKYG